MSSQNPKIVVVLDLPKAPADKHQKLLNTFKNALKTVDPKANEYKIEIPIADDKIIGIALILCDSDQSAKRLAHVGDHLYLDKTTKLRFLHHSEYLSYIQGSNKPQTLDVPIPNEDTNLALNWYLARDGLEDQIIYLSAPDSRKDGYVKGSWFSPDRSTVTDFKIETNITAKDVAFSSNGSFLITKEENKLKFYIGEKWSHYTTFEFRGVGSFMSSPDGFHVIAKAQDLQKYDNEKQPRGAAVFSLKRGRMLRKIPLTKDNEDYLQFGHDSNIFNMWNNKLICYSFKTEYKTPQLVSNDTIHQFYPSVAHPFIFTFKKAETNLPPRISFYLVEKGADKKPDEKKADDKKPEEPPLKFTNLTSAPAFRNTEDCDVYWHPKHKYCAVVQNKKTKSNEIVNTLTIFDFTKPKSVSHHQEEFNGIIHSFSWDPSTAEGQTPICALLSTITTEEKRVCKLTVFEVGDQLIRKRNDDCQKLSKVIFSPAGKYFIAHDEKTLQFWSMEDGRIKSEVLEGLFSVQWDHTGAFVLAGSKPSNVHIYMLDGQKVCSKNSGSLKSVMWRPRQDDAAFRLDEKIYKKTEAEFNQRCQESQFGIIDKENQERENKKRKKEAIRRWNELRLAAPSLKTQFREKLSRADSISISYSTE